MPASPVMIDNDLSDCSLDEALERLEAGKCGHAAVMRYIGTDSYHELVATMHFNGRMMPGHRDMILTPETMDLLARLPKRDLDSAASKAGETKAPRRTSVR
jgi:hypothetical protein